MKHEHLRIIHACMKHIEDHAKTIQPLIEAELKKDEDAPREKPDMFVYDLVKKLNHISAEHNAALMKLPRGWWPAPIEDDPND